MQPWAGNAHVDQAVGFAMEEIVVASIFAAVHLKLGARVRLLRVRQVHGEMTATR